MDVQHCVLQNEDSHPVGYILPIAELPAAGEVAPGIGAFDPTTGVFYISNGVDTWHPYHPVPTGLVHGDVLFYNGTAFVCLPAGTDGHIFTTHGPGQDPTWTPPATGTAADHGTLTGLTDDDHLQYLTNGRGDARYYTRTALQTSGQAAVHWDNLTNTPASFPPTAHAGTHATGQADAITPTSIGAMAAPANASHGDLLIRGAAGWGRLPPGAAGQVLKTQGVGADPLWGDVTIEGGNNPVGLPVIHLWGQDLKPPGGYQPVTAPGAFLEDYYNGGQFVVALDQDMPEACNGSFRIPTGATHLHVTIQSAATSPTGTTWVPRMWLKPMPARRGVTDCATGPYPVWMALPTNRVLYPMSLAQKLGNWQISGPEPTEWQTVNSHEENAPAGRYTTWYNTGSSLYALDPSGGTLVFGLQGDIPDDWTIHSVLFRIGASYGAGSSCWQIVKSGGTQVALTHPGGFGEFTLTTDPATGQAWTPAAVNTLQVGIGSDYRNNMLAVFNAEVEVRVAPPMACLVTDGTEIGQGTAYTYQTFTYDLDPAVGQAGVIPALALPYDTEIAFHLARWAVDPLDDKVGDIYLRAITISFS